jgi:deazaflavin-dependent oxidoreductase (nitroreductase family)
LSTARLRHVDPTRRRGAIARAYLWFLKTPLMTWLTTTSVWSAVVWRIDPPLLRLTGGRLGLGLLLPTALLETRGARSGQPRRNAVIYFHDGDRVIVVASKAGLPGNPAWYHNVRAHPDDIKLGGRPFAARTVTDTAQRERLWRLADSVFPAFATYRTRAAAAGRTIPIIELTPRDGA